MKKYAVIDIGSNSVRMTVYEAGEKGPVTIKSTRKYVRLSEGMEKDNLLKAAAVERTISALAETKAEADESGAERVYCIATEAVRRADNANEFLMLAKEKTGFSIRVLTGDEEAETGFLAVAKDMGDGYNIILDVGGGSAEITLAKNKKLVGAVSLRLGAVVLTERFAGRPQTELYNFVYEKLADIGFLKGIKNAPIIALGGTASTITRVFSTETLSNGQIDMLYERLCSLPPCDRHKINGIEPQRADIILAGVTVFKALLDFVGGVSFKFSKSNIRDGFAKKIYDGEI